MSMIFRPKPPPQKYRALYDKIRSAGERLDAMCNVYRGIWTGILHVFIVTEEEVREYNLEEGGLKPILRGKDIGPFRYKWAKRWVIYTNQPKFDEKYPNIIKYLEQWKRILERRGAVWIYERHWWELEDPLEPKMFEIPKLLTPYISKMNAFAFESEGKYYALDSTTIIRFWFDESEARDYFLKWKETNEKHLDVGAILDRGFEIIKELGKNEEGYKYILGILNSDIIEFLYKLYAPRVTKRGTRRTIGRYFLYIPPYLNIVPIKIADTHERRDLIKLVDKLIDKAMKVVDVENEKEKMNLEEEIAMIMADLNEVVFDFYGLSEDEKAIVQAYVLRRR